MKYEVLTLGSYGTNCYLVWDEKSLSCAVIDPGYEPERIAERLQALSLRPSVIFLTHGHFDHVGGVPVLRRMLNVPVYLNEKDETLPESLTAGPLCHTDTYAEGDALSVGAVKFRVLETPGHTKGSVCLLTGDTLFSGDTLFAGSCGRTDLPGGSRREMAASLKRLSDLPGDYTVLPGHGEATTLDQERRYNPYF